MSIIYSRPPADRLGGRTLPKQPDIVQYSHANETCIDRNARLGTPTGTLCGTCTRDRKTVTSPKHIGTCGHETTILRSRCIHCDLMEQNAAMALRARGE